MQKLPSISDFKWCHATECFTDCRVAVSKKIKSPNFVICIFKKGQIPKRGKKAQISIHLFLISLLKFWHTFMYFLRFWHTFWSFSTLSHTFSSFGTLSHTFLSFSTLSHILSSFSTLSHTFSTFTTLSQVLAHFLNF